METSTPLGNVSISCRKRELEVPYYVRNETLYDLVRRLREKGDAAAYFEENLIKKVKGWQNDGKNDCFIVSGMRIGDLAIILMPGELFTAWGLEIKRFSPATHTFVVELASSHDGLTAYKPTSDQAMRGARGKGGYVTLPILSQKHCPEAGRMMTEAAIGLLHELWLQ